MRRATWLFLTLAFLLPVAVRAGQQEEELLLAVRKGDAAAVKALLAKGVNVNTKFRYDRTALSFAADRGYVEVVKVLLENGADVNIKDTFYGATPLDLAADKGHAEVVRLLLEKGATGIDNVLLGAAREGQLELVKVVLEKGGYKPETLSAALSLANRNNHTEIAELLKKAGAAPPPKADFKVDAETLDKYAGTYRIESGQELIFTVRDGKLQATAGDQTFNLSAVNKNTFQVDEAAGVTVVFNLESEKVVSLTVKEGANDSLFKRVEPKP